MLKLLFGGRGVWGGRSFHVNAEMTEVTRQRLKTVIPYVNTCRVRGRREAAGTGGMGGGRQMR